MSDDLLQVTPFPRNDSANFAPVLPDVEKRESLGSGMVTRVLGQGGMANVYEVWVPQLEVFRAVKIIKPESTKDTKERFQTEIRILAKLSHPNIIDIHNVGEWKGMPYIEMDKIEGDTLDDLIYDRGALSAVVCVSIGIMVCRALALAHAHEYVIYGKTYKGIIHRDLKPGNVMLCKNGELKLMDFGIARPVDASFHTIDGTIVGTIQYMSPELLKGEKLDFRADIYAFGVTLYELLTGINAFPEPNFSKLITLKQKNQFRPIHEFKLKLPAKLIKLITRCMHEDRKKRIGNTESLLTELERIHRQMTNESPEKILRKFAKEKPGKKYIPSIGRVIPWKAIILFPIGMLVFILTLQIGIRSYTRTVLNKNSDIKKLAPPPSSTVNSVSSLKKVKLEEVVEVNTIQLEESNLNKKNNNLKNEKNTERKPKKKLVSQPANKKTAASSEDSKNRIKEPIRVAKKISHIEKLSVYYGLTNPLDIMLREYEVKKYTSVINLYKQLPSSLKKQDRGKIYYMRALVKLRKNSELSRFLSKNNINDGEFLLTKAQNAYRKNQIQTSLSLLNNSLNAPKQFIDYNSLKQQVFYYRALCASKLFDKDTSEKHYLQALEEWRNLGVLFNNNKNHSLFKEYRKETRRIGEKYRKKGD